MMRRNCLLSGIALLMAFNVFALDVDVPEVESTRAAAIEFINYVGPHTVIESADSIRGIGRNLGAAVAGGAARAGEAGRYSVIHAVDPAVLSGFDADILFVGEGARVDHIDNLRRIIAGFLEGAYSYSKKDADTLAVFITIYNAIYRGKLDYFASKYKPVVTKELGPNTAGLAIRWDEWAGRSRIVIPLSARAGSGVIGSVDTSPISDKATVESLKKESDDMGIGERKDLVDIKERSQEEAKAAIAAEKERIAKEEKALAEEKAKAEAAQAGAGSKEQTEQKAQSQDDSKAAQKEPTDLAGTSSEQKAEKGSQQEASMAVSDKAKEEEKAIAEKEARLEEDKARLDEREKALEAKDKEIAADRADIAKDQKEAIRDEIADQAAKEAAGSMLFELLDPNLPFSRLSLVDLKTGASIRKSQVNTIRANTAQDTGTAIIAIAGQTGGVGGAVRLVSIAKNDYRNVVYSNEDVFADSPLWKYGNSIYVVIKKGNDWIIGRYDSPKLELKAGSAPISRFSFLSQTASGLVAQGPDGGFLVLDPDSLATRSEIKR